MSVDLSRVREVFLVARNLGPAERCAYLDQTCGADQELRSEIESLLQHDPGDHGAMAEGIDRVIGAAAGRLIESDDPERLGGFRILGRVGEGGMGLVYRARQDGTDRMVALKVLRSAALTAEQLARFQLETHVLARLQHPSIAQIYEAGTFGQAGETRPYFAMELVEGETLDAFVQRKHLSTPERVELMIQVCDGVHHAHQKGVIHRDLKPGNILVNTDGQVKILDFGVARATDSDIRTTTLRTNVGQLMGTIPYMSPEQVAGNPHDLDLRSDVYSLGVTFYELLCGQLPHTLEQTSLPEALRIIQEDQPLRLSRVTSGLPADLETIVDVAMQKEPTRRYQSAAALAEDLRRHLEDLPILSRRPSSGYQLRLFARRHRVLVTAAALVLATLLTATVVSSLATIRANRAAANESRQRFIAERVNSYLTEILRLPDSHRFGEDVTVLEMVGQVQDRLDGAVDEPIEVEAVVRDAIGKTYASLRRFEQADAELQRASELWRHLDNQPRLASTMGVLGVSLSSQQRYEEATGIHREVLAMVQERGASGPELTKSRVNLIESLYQLRQFDEAHRLIEQGLATHRASGTPSQPLGVFLIWASRVNLARGDVDRAAREMEETLEIWRMLNPEDELAIATALADLGHIRHQQGRLAEAIELTGKAWGLTRDGRPVGSIDWMSMASQYLKCLRAMDRRAETVTLLNEVGDRLLATLGPDDFRTREVWNILARRYDTWGEPEKAAAVRAAHPTARLSGQHHRPEDVAGQPPTP